MNADEKYIMREESRIDDEFYCEGCGKTVDGIAALDPIEIDGRLFCDSCASDLTALRMEETIEGVALKTKKLK